MRFVIPRWQVRSFLAIAGAILAGVAPAAAELGDYTALQTLANLVSPPGPNNPVSSAERQGPYPLKTSPSTFSDGFQPGRYYEWQTIQLHPSTDAVCGNGTPFKFFVNRVPNTRNTLIYLEGGGACWDGRAAAAAPASAARAIPMASPTTTWPRPTRRPDW